MRHLHLTVFALTIILPVSIGFARQGEQRSVQDPSKVLNPKVAERYELLNKRQWTGDDKPFVMIRERVDRELNITKDKLQLIKSYKAIAELTDNLSDQFRWAYSVYQTYKDKPDQRWHFREPSSALIGASAPKSYEFSRLQFLLESEGMHKERLRELAIRLIDRSPDDLDVMIAAITVLLESSDKESQSKVMQITRRLERIKPRNQKLTSVITWAYDITFMKSGNLEQGRKAKNYYEYLLKNAKDEFDKTFYEWRLKKTTARIAKNTLVNKK